MFNNFLGKGLVVKSVTYLFMLAVGLVTFMGAGCNWCKDKCHDKTATHKTTAENDAAAPAAEGEVATAAQLAFNEGEAAVDGTPAVAGVVETAPQAVEEVQTVASADAVETEQHA